MEDSRPIFPCKRFSYNENALYCHVPCTMPVAIIWRFGAPIDVLSAALERRPSATANAVAATVDASTYDRAPAASGQTAGTHAV